MPRVSSASQRHHPWRSLGELARITAVTVVIWCANSSPAHACSCAGDQPSSLDWPSTSQTDVALAPVLTIFDRSGLPVLRSDDGIEIALASFRTLSFGRDCAPRLSFARPVAMLAPNTKYQVVIDPGGRSERAVELTTGTTVTPASEEKLGLDIAYYRVNRTTCSAPTCGSRVELRVTISDARTELPETWLRAWVDGSETARTVKVGPTTSDVYLAFDSRRDAPCIAYEVIDRNGEVREQKTLCEPDKCLTARGELFESSGCGEVFAYGPELWDRIEDASCASPPLVHVDEGRGFEVGLDMDGACSVRLARSRRPWFAAALLAGACFGLRRRRRGDPLPRL